MSQPDDINAKISRTLNQIQNQARGIQKEIDQSPAGKAARDWSMLATFWFQLVHSVGWIYNTFLQPITRTLIRFGRWGFKHYRSIWTKLVYRNDQYGDPEFSKIRGGLFIIGTIFSACLTYVMIMILIGTGWYFLTVQYDEELYLYNSIKTEDGANPYSSFDDVYEVHGCETLPCGDQDSVTFKVEPSWFNEAWSIFHNGTLFYPEYVAGAVAPVMNQCTITSYGIRKKFKAIVRQWNIYPSLIQVKKCSPVEDGAKVLHNNDYR